MSDTKTLGERLDEAKRQAHDASEAKFLADNEVNSLERRLSLQADDFANLQQAPDYQQAMIAQWRHWCEARKASGLGIEEFVASRWEAERSPPPIDDHATHLRILQEREAMERAKIQADAARRLTRALYPNAEKTQDFEVSLKEVRALALASETRQHAAKANALADTGGGPPPARCSCGAMEACARCPELQVPPEIAAYINDHARVKTAQGVNSVVRGKAGPPLEDTSVHAQASVKLGDAVRALADAALKLGAVAPWLGETYGNTARDIAKQAEALGYRADALKRVVAP